MDISDQVIGVGAASGDLSAAPGIVVGILLILAAILWFSPAGRWRFKHLVGWLVVGAIAAIIIVGYLGLGPGGST